jgi:hypothetical protein
MNNPIVIVGILITSLLLGLIKYGSLTTAYKGKSWHLKFIEIWNDFTNFLIAGLVGYYFFSIRWPLLAKGESLYTSDFILFIIFVLGLFGHLCIMSKNITDGVEVILKRILEK